MKEPISLFNERYWKEVKGVEKEEGRKVIGIFHSLFISQSPSALHFHQTSIPFPLPANQRKVGKEGKEEERKVYIGREGEVLLLQDNSIFSLTLLPQSPTSSPSSSPSPGYHWTLLLSNHFSSNWKKFEDKNNNNNNMDGNKDCNNSNMDQQAKEEGEEEEEEEEITAVAFINFTHLYFATSFGRVYSLFHPIQRSSNHSSPSPDRSIASDDHLVEGGEEKEEEEEERSFDRVQLIYSSPPSHRLIFNQICYINTSTLILLTKPRALPSSSSSLFSEVHSLHLLPPSLHILPSSSGRRVGEMRMLSRSSPPYIKILCLNDHLWTLTSDYSLHSFPFHPSFLSFSTVNDNNNNNNNNTVNNVNNDNSVNNVNNNNVNNYVNEKEYFGEEGEEIKYFTLSYAESKLGNETKIKDIIDDGSFVYGFPLVDNNNNNNNANDKYRGREEKIIRLSSHRLLVKTTSSLDKVWDSSSSFPSSPLSISFDLFLPYHYYYFKFSFLFFFINNIYQ